MAVRTLRVLRQGKGTFLTVRFSDGKAERTLIRRGAGVFLEPTFETEQAAADFCTEELRKDPTAILYILEGNSILRTFLDKDRQQTLERIRGRQFGIRSTLLFSFLSVIGAHPF